MFLVNRRESICRIPFTNLSHSTTTPASLTFTTTHSSFFAYSFYTTTLVKYSLTNKGCNYRIVLTSPFYINTKAATIRPTQITLHPIDLLELYPQNSNTASTLLHTQLCTTYIYPLTRYHVKRIACHTNLMIALVYATTITLHKVAPHVSGHQLS